jgi:hypothetical protein
MAAEFDYDLTRDQWETLKSLRGAAKTARPMDRSAVAALIDLGLAAVNAEVAVLTAAGRKVLVRGSSRLLDVAA